MPRHVVIGGGGVGALEALLALQHHAADRVRISVVTPSRHLVYRASSVAEPFGGEPAPRYEWERIAHDRGVEWIPDAITEVRPPEIVTAEGPPLRYDALLLALGARPEAAVPGALTFAGPRDVLAVREAIEAQATGTIAFVAPGGVAWTLPLYELALMTAAHGRRRRLDLRVELITRERTPLDAFGPAASDAVAQELAQAGIRVRTGSFAQEYDAGKLWLELEGPVAVDLAIALPRLRGPALPGLPEAENGFVAVDPYGRVRGADGVWAVGDMTTRPLKQGGLAAQQADVAAADIAARVAGADVDVRPYAPRLRGKLLTGDAPLYVEHRRGRSEASADFLWWPAGKVAGHHLGPYLEQLSAA